jgi:regulator of ribonuclease activity A
MPTDDSTAMTATADICDAHPADVRVAQPIFQHFGGAACFSGRVTTVRVFEDNVLVRRALEQSRPGAVLVVDGGGSLECALVGDILAGLGVANGWQGIVVNGCIRDAAPIARLAIGIRALNTHPLKSAKTGEGQQDVPVSFAGVTFTPGDYLYADADGLILSARRLV